MFSLKTSGGVGNAGVGNAPAGAKKSGKANAGAANKLAGKDLKIVGTPAKSAALTPDKLYSENNVIANTILIKDSKDNLAVLKPTLQAALKANKNIKIAIVVDALTYGPRKYVVMRELSKTYGIPQQNIIPIINDRYGDIGEWSQDGFFAGEQGITESSHVTYHSSDIADLMVDRLKLKKFESSSIYMGGDLQFLTMPDGKQMVYFGHQTASAVASGNPSRHPIDRSRMKAIVKIMEDMEKRGVALENVMPIGIGDTTYGKVLEEMNKTPEGQAMLAEFPPHILKRLEQMKDLVFPNQKIERKGANFAYHTDLIVNSLDGQTFLLNEDDAKEYPALKQTLEFFDKTARTLPALQKEVVGEKKEHNGRIYYVGAGSDEDRYKWSERLTYMNWTMGKTPNGSSFILLPTDTADTSKLTEADKAAIKTLQETYPGVDVIPIGGRTGWLSDEYSNTNASRNRRDWGPHCSTQILPWQFDARGQLVAQPPLKSAKAPLAKK